LLYRLAAVVASSGNTASEFVSPLKHTVYALTLKTIHSVHVVYWHVSYDDHRKHYSQNQRTDGFFFHVYIVFTVR